MAFVEGVPSKYISKFSTTNSSEKPSSDVPEEYLQCFEVNDYQVPEDSMAVHEQAPPDLYEVANMEWKQWKPQGEANGNEVVEVPAIKQIMKLDDYRNFRQEIESMELDHAIRKESEAKIKESSKKPKQSATKRSPYRSYDQFQIQELLDLVIEQGISARQASFATGIVVRTGQHYVRQYKLDEEKKLPGVKKSYLGGNNRKLESRHSKLLIDYFDSKPDATLWQARELLYAEFPGLSISMSALQKHLVLHCSLTKKLLEARNSERTIRLRKEKVTKFSFETNSVFIDEVGFNMHLRRNFGRSKRGIPAKAIVPSNRGIYISILGAICEKCVIDLTLRKPKAVSKAKKSKKKEN